jgi:NADPH:quinone reductase-like Zn-dependent oxidoreductase
MLQKELGAEYVLNSADENFDADLYKLSVKLDCNVALECVAGDMTGRVLQVLSNGGILISYG